MQLNGHELIVLATTLGLGGVAVSLAAKLLKKVAKGHLDQDIHKVVLALTAVASGAQYFQQLHATLPPTVLGISGASIYGVSQLVYRASTWTTGALGKVQAKADGAPARVQIVPETSETPATPAQATF